MARTKIAPRHDDSAKRTSWTRFHLPRGQEWPTWSSSYSDPYLGPLTDVEACWGVWLGRKVEDPEQAAFIILWGTAEGLKNFQHSPAGAQFLRDLPEHETQASIASSTSRLQNLSLGDDVVKDGASLLWSPHRRFLTLKCEPAPLAHWGLEGRITITALEVIHGGNDPYTDRSWSEARDRVFGSFVPDDLMEHPHWSPTSMMQWRWWALVVTEEGNATAVQAEPQVAPPAAGSSSSSNQSTRAVWCEFRRWEDDSDATLELEEFNAQSQGARESWAQAVAQLMPPVTAWEQQDRWDVHSAPREDEI